MKILSSLLLILIMPAAALAAFTDVTEESSYFEAIEYAQTNGIVNGYDDGTYRPNDTINRAEFVKILVESNFKQADIESCTVDAMAYTDVPSAVWYVPYVCVATKNGIIQGYEDNTFRGASTINFVEAAKIIVATKSGDLEGSPWYKPYVTSLADSNAIPTAITVFDHKVTRGEMAEMMHRTILNIDDKPSTTYAALAGEQRTEALLAPVDGSSTSGDATATWSDNEYRVVATFSDLPEALPGFFYEGWVVRPGDNLSIISTGKADMLTGNIFTSSQNLMDHTKYVLTLEPDDGDPAPAEHVAEGDFN